LADEQDALLREIDDELKQENLQQIWKKYGTLIVAGSVALVAGIAGFKGWQAYDLNQRTAQGERFAAAQKLIGAGKNEDALGAFGAISKDSTAGYAMLARFQLAALAATDGDMTGAIDGYRVIADDTALSTIYRELAVIQGALVELDSKAGAGPLTERAAGLVDGNSPWRFSAKEITALAALKNGDKKTARMRYDELAKEAAAPQGLRSRAGEMLKILPGK